MVKILVTDDAIFTRKLLSDILKKEGHEIIEAENAAEAVKKYKELKPDLVTMDIIMPEVEGMDGIGAVKAIIKADPSAKIVMVSAMGQQEMIVDAIQAGAKGFIIKPFSEDAVLDEIKRILKD